MTTTPPIEQVPRKTDDPKNKKNPKIEDEREKTNEDDTKIQK